MAAIRAASGELLGALALRPTPGSDRSPDHELVAAAAEHLGRLLEHPAAGDEASNPYEALVEIGTQIQAEEVHADTVLQLIVDRARELCGTDVSWLALVDEERERVKVAVAAGTTTAPFLDMAVRVGTGIGGAAVTEGRTIVVRDQELYGNHMPKAVRHALRGEGVVSVLCSPMVRAGRMVGALYLGSRTHIDFGDASVPLLEALAAQAAIAIENGRLYQALADKNAMLERSFQIHRSLTDASLAGAGLNEIARRLAELVGRDVVLVQDGIRQERTRHTSDPGPDGWMPFDRAVGELCREEAMARIVAGEDQLGTLYAVGETPLSEMQRRALEHGATVLALELVKERAALEVEWRLQGELLDEILRAEAELSDGLRIRAQQAGIDLERLTQVAVLRPRDDSGLPLLLHVVHLALRQSRAEGGALMTKRGDRVIVATGDHDARHAEERMRTIQRKAERAGVDVAIGTSGGRSSAAQAHRAAEGALGLADASGGRRPFVAYDDLGPLRFLLDAPDTTEMIMLVRRSLEALVVHDRRGRAQLMPTLRAFLEADGHQPAAAERCHIHVSTLKYRMRRIAALLGRSPQDPGVRFELWLAFGVLDVLAMLGIDPFAVEAGPAS